MSVRPAKTCATCGRSFEWRKKWERNWDEVRYCSKRCRTGRPVEQDRMLEGAILELLASRASGATICPSEAARQVFEEWRPHMERVRSAARRLAMQGVVEITQRGQPVSPDDIRGPIRIRLARDRRP